jgi:hypothetical protein
VRTTVVSSAAVSIRAPRARQCATISGPSQCIPPTIPAASAAVITCSISAAIVGESR